MALVRTDVEDIVVARLSNLMHAAGMVVTGLGISAGLNDPLARAVRMVGGTTAQYSTTTSAEIAAVGEALYDDLFDLAEYYTLKAIQGNRAASHSAVQIATERLERLKVDLSRYLSVADAGLISLNFAEHGE